MILLFILLSHVLITAVTVAAIRKTGHRFVKCRIVSIEVSGIQVILNHAQSFTESLVMNHFSCTQETYRICYFRYVSNYTQDIIVCASSLLFCCHIFMKISNRISLRLKFTGIKWNTSRSLRPIQLPYGQYNMVQIRIFRFLP